MSVDVFLLDELDDPHTRLREEAERVVKLYGWDRLPNVRERVEQLLEQTIRLDPLADESIAKEIVDRAGRTSGGGSKLRAASEAMAHDIKRVVKG